MISLATRSHAEEQMDSADLPAEVYAAVLNDLGRVNRWTFAARPTLRFLDRLVRTGETLRILDVGFGDGGMLRSIARWARRRGIATRLVGVDLNPGSAPVARALTPPDMPIEYRTGDYADQGEAFDIILSSLVAHHMTPDQLDAFIRHMEGHARRGWFINDLHRHRIAYAGYPVLARLLGVHPIVRQDGTLSIARAFRPAEWDAILQQAGIPDQAVRVRRYMPFRLCVERRR